VGVGACLVLGVGPGPVVHGPVVHGPVVRGPWSVVPGPAAAAAAAVGLGLWGVGPAVWSWVCIKF
jgi:hypothetical protein